MTDSRQIVRMWFRVLFIALLSFPIVVSLLPIEYTPPTFDIWDKILHPVTTIERIHRMVTIYKDVAELKAKTE